MSYFDVGKINLANLRDKIDILGINLKKQF